MPGFAEAQAAFAAARRSGAEAAHHRRQPQRPGQAARRRDPPLPGDRRQVGPGAGGASRRPSLDRHSANPANGSVQPLADCPEKRFQRFPAPRQRLHLTAAVHECGHSPRRMPCSAERRQVRPARIGRRRQRRLGVVGDAEPRRATMSRSLAPSPTASTASRAMPGRRRRAPQRGELGLAAEDRPRRPRRSARRPRRAARWPAAGEAGRRRDALGEEAEAARDQRRLRPERRHGPHQRPRARVEPHPLGVAALEDRPPAAPSAARPARSAPPRSRARRASPRSVIAATSALTPGEVGELVDALDADDRRIHVGDQQPLAPPGRRHDVRVAPRRPRSRRAARRPSGDLDAPSPPAAAAPARRRTARRLGRRVGDAGGGGQHQDRRPATASDGGAARLQAAGAASRPPGRPVPATAPRSAAGRRRCGSGRTGSRRVTARTPPVHSVTSLPVISKCTPPGMVPSALWIAKNSRTSRSTRSNGRVL